jgi:hypothetical protein
MNIDSMRQLCDKIFGGLKNLLGLILNDNYYLLLQLISYLITLVYKNGLKPRSKRTFLFRAG